MTMTNVTPNWDGLTGTGRSSAGSRFEAPEILTTVR